MNVFNTSFTKPLLAVGLSLSLFACGGDKSAEQPPATDTAQTPPKAEGVITVAVTQDFAPFTYLDDKGNVVGFDVDIINAIAKNKGLNVQFKATTFDNIFTDVENKEADIGASGIYDKEERRAKYGLTKPYHIDRPVYFYRADNEKITKINPTSLADLNALTLNVATVGSVDGLSANHKIESVRSEFSGFTGVLQGKYDVAFSDASVLNHYIKSHPDSSQTPLKTVEYQGDVGYVMVVNKENVELLNTLNEGIDELAQNGELKQIEEKYGLTK